MADEAIIYRCINEACGRPAPRPVNFCPWCGTAQGRAGVRAPSPAAANAAAPGGSDAATAAAAGASAAAALSGWSDAPSQPEAPAAAAPRAAQPADAQRAEAATPSSAARQGPAPTPSATEFGHAGKGVPPAGPAAPPPQEVPRPPLEARPPQRKPIRLRWWVLALAVLWGVWLMAKPSARKIDRRIDAAIALAHQCKGSEAQAELIALRKSSATPEQLQRLQQGLNDEAAICTRRRQRAAAWEETSAAAESALASAGWEKARTRLNAFIRRWGEDDRTRALKARIEDARREDEARRSHPLAAPSE